MDDALVLHAGEGIVMTPAAAGDAGEYAALIEANRAALVRWLPWAETSRTRDDVLAFVAADLAARRAGTAITFTLRVDGAVAGGIGVHDVNRQHDVGAAGYWLGARFHGRGVMTRALDRLAAFALGDYGLHRLEVLAAVPNARSRAVAERAGFAFEAILRERARAPHGYDDCALYARLAAAR